MNGARDPARLRGVLEHLRELQEIEQHLPSESISRRICELVDRTVELHRSNPEAFESEAHELAGEPFEHALALAARDAITDRLRVIRIPDCYLLRYIAGSSRERILALFATDTLPLPWTLDASSEEVVADVRRSHPHAFVQGPLP